MEQERLQKVLARAGLGSRREIESWIRDGLISVNGQRAELGMRVGARDQIRVRGRRINPKRLEKIERVVIVYNKPEGELVARRDPDGRPSVFANLPRPPCGRWVAVGRLDINSAGLLLFTNDGELANRLMHPSSEVEREYAVRTLGEASDEVLERLRNGVQLDDGMARFDSIRDAGGQGVNHWYHVTLREGRNREVRRLWESQDLRVSRLIRVRYGPVHLPRNLRRGKARRLTDNEVRVLARSVGLDTPSDRPQRGQRKGRGRAASPRATRRPKRH